MLQPHWSCIRVSEYTRLFQPQGLCTYYFILPGKLFLFFFWQCTCFSGGSHSEESACNAGNPGSIPGLGRYPGEGNGYPLQYPCLKNSMDRGAWQATIHGVAKSWSQLSDLTLLCWHTPKATVFTCNFYRFYTTLKHTAGWVNANLISLWWNGTIKLKKKKKKVQFGNWLS